MRPVIFHNFVDGLRLAQSKHVDAMLKALRRKKIKKVIEIGTYHGGFASLLADYFQTVVTFDVDDWGTADEISYRDKVFREKGINFYKDNPLEDRWNYIFEEPGILVLCDGGHKMNEFTKVGKLAKKGTIIGAHDAGKNRDWFMENIYRQGLWTESFEFCIDDVAGFCEENGLKPILKKTAQKAVWFLAQKQ